MSKKSSILLFRKAYIFIREKRLLLIITVLIALSPWFWVFARNYSLILPFKEKYYYLDQSQIDEIDMLRGEAIASNLGIPGRLLINKYSYFAKEIFIRYLKTSDPHYLFFEGDVDLKRSTHAFGPLYLSFLPLLIYGLMNSSKSSKKTKLLLLLFLIIAPIPAIFIYKYNETLVSIPSFIILTIFTGIGLNTLLKKKRFLALIFIFIILFEFAKFQHDFFVHYPDRIAKQIYSFK